MGKMFTDEQVATARNANLYRFLLAHHPDDVEQEGHALRFKNDHTITILEDSNLFMDWTDEKRDSAGDGTDKPNAISFLTNHLGYSFVSAVKSLLNDEKGATILPMPKTENRANIRSDFIVPEKAPVYRQTMAYLTQTRGIDAKILQDLINHGLLYQEKDTGNAVFLNKERTFYEKEGTLSDVRWKRAKGTEDGLKAWYYFPHFYKNPLQPPMWVYICESAIDAISLYELLGDEWSVYLSTAGAGKARNTIEQLLARPAWKDKLIIATDNDEAGDKPRNLFPDLQTIRPNGGDWNDDLRERKAADLV